MSNITANLKSIRDIMRKNTDVHGDAQRISQRVWMQFMKIFADKEEKWEITIDNYNSPIPEELKWQSWASDEEGLTGEQLMDFINNELFPGLRELDPQASPQAPSVIKSWLEGNFDFSLRSVCALDWGLGERLWEGGAGKKLQLLKGFNFWLFPGIFGESFAPHNTLFPHSEK